MGHYRESRQRAVGAQTSRQYHFGMLEVTMDFDKEYHVVYIGSVRCKNQTF